MKRQLGAIVGAVLVLCAPLAWSQSDSSSSSITSGNIFTTWTTDTTQSGGTGDSAQSGSDTTQSGASGPQDTFSNPEKLPALSLFRDAAAHTGVSWNFTAGTLIQNVSGNGYGNYQSLSTFASGLNILQIRPAYSWSVGYSGGLNVTTGSSNLTYKNLNQAASAEVKWRLAKLWQLDARDSYFYSDDPFQPFLTYVGNPTPNNPNPVVYFPQAVIEQNQAHLNLSHPLGAHDMLVFGGGESFQRYLRANQIYSLWNSFTYSGSAFYQHAFSARLSGGGGYQYAALDYGHGQSRAGVGTFEGFLNYAFSSRMEASVWVGPQRTTTKDKVPVFCYQNGCFYEIKHGTHFSVSEGGTFKWIASDKDSFGAEFSHGVNNGGGTLGVANIYQVTGTYNRPLNRIWVLGAGVMYSNSNSVTLFRSRQYLISSTGTVGISRKLFNDAWHMNAYYAFIRQSQNYTGLPTMVTTSGLGLSLRYIWDFGIGR